MDSKRRIWRVVTLAACIAAIALVASAPAPAVTVHDITISAGPTTGGSFSGGNPNVFTPTADGAVLSITDLETALGSANVVVGTAGSTSTITVNSDVTSNSGNSLDFAAGSGITVFASSVSTTGPQTYNAPVTFTSDSNIQTPQVTFGSTVDGSANVTVTGSAQFNGNVGAGTALANLHVTGGTQIGAAQVKTNAFQDYDGAVIMAADSNLTASTVTFNSAVNSIVNGTGNLTVTGNANLHGLVGFPNALQGFHVTGHTFVDTDLVFTTQAQTYDASVDLTVGSANFESPTVIFKSTVNGATDVNVTGNAVFGDSIGGSASLSSLHVTGAMQFAGGSISTQGTQNFDGPITLGGDSTLNATIATLGAVDGPFALDINAAASLNGQIGSVLALESLHVNSNVQVDNGATLVKVNDTQTYDGSVALFVSSTLAGASVEVADVVGLNAQMLTVSGGGVLSDVVSGTGGLVKQGSGTLTLAAANTYTGPTSVSGGVLTVTGTLPGALTVAAGGRARVSGTVGGLVTLQAAAELTCSGGTLSGGVTNNGGTATGAPAAPTNVVATPGDQSATVSFTPGAANCFPVSYRATAAPGGAEATGSGSPLTVSGLTNGTGYSFAVRGENPIGPGAYSAPIAPVVPAGPPASPPPSPPLGSPAITVTAPSPGATYLLGHEAASSFSCTDSAGIASCADAGGKPAGALLDTNSLGPHSLTIDATTPDGRTASTTVSYTVVPAFLKFAKPKRKAGRLTVGFTLGSEGGKALDARAAAQVRTRVTLSTRRSGTPAVVTAPCSFRRGAFSCTIRLPRKKAKRYFVTAYQQIGAAWVAIPRGRLSL